MIARRLFLENVDRRAGDAFVLERVLQFRFVHQSAAGGIDDDDGTVAQPRRRVRCVGLYIVLETVEGSRAVVRRLYDGVIATGRAEDADMVADDYIQNSGWTPDGRSAFASALAISRGAMPDGRALQTHMVAENNRLASRSVWDGTITESGRPADFTSLDFFRIDDGLIAEHWETVDWVRVYQSFGLLSDEVQDG